MSSITTATMPLAVSRPKVHRLPAAGRTKNNRKNLFSAFLLFWGVGLVVVIAATLSVKKEPVIKAATMLPAVAVVSERLPVPASKDKPVVNDTIGVLSGPIGEAQAAPTPVSTYTTPDNSDTTIRLKDDSSVIVGQMARIPIENGEITEVKRINTVDNGGGRELLSIVGKY